MARQCPSGAGIRVRRPAGGPAPTHGGRESRPRTRPPASAPPPPRVSELLPAAPPEAPTSQRRPRRRHRPPRKSRLLAPAALAREGPSRWWAGRRPRHARRSSGRQGRAGQSGAPLVRGGRSTAPRRGPFRCRGSRLRAVPPATRGGRSPRSHGRAVRRRASPGSLQPGRGVSRSAGCGGALGAVLGLAGVRVRGHLRPGAGPGAGGERGGRAAGAEGAAGRGRGRPGGGGGGPGGVGPRSRELSAREEPSGRAPRARRHLLRSGAPATTPGVRQRLRRISSAAVTAPHRPAKSSLCGSPA